MRRWILSGLLAALAVGCSTIERAREAQSTVDPRARDLAVMPKTAPLDLRLYTLENLVAYALTNRPNVVSARLAMDDARLALKALAPEAPVLSDSPWTSLKLTAGADHTESSAGTTLREHDWRTAGDPSAALSLNLLLYDFGRYDAKARAQAERVIAAELNLAAVGQQVFLAVAEGYFTFLEKRALLEVSRTNERQYADHLFRAEEQLKAGEANRLDVLRARLDLATARQVVVTASNQVDTAGATLLQALGVDAARGTSASVFGCAPVRTDAVRRGFASSESDVTSLYFLARTNAPAVRAARAKLRAASHAVDYAVADLKPSVSASTSLAWTNPLWFWNWGVSVTESITAGLGRLTAIDRAVVAMKSASADVETEEQKLSLELETAVSNRDNSRAAVASALASVRSARENLATVREQFAVGSASRVELSEAIAADSQARGDCISAFYAGQRAEAALQALVGRYPVFNEEIVEGEIK